MNRCTFSLFQVQSIEASWTACWTSTSRCCGKAWPDPLAPSQARPSNVNRRRTTRARATAGTRHPAPGGGLPVLGQQAWLGLQLILAPGELRPGAQRSAPRRRRRPGARETAWRPRAAWRLRRRWRGSGRRPPATLQIPAALPVPGPLPHGPAGAPRRSPSSAPAWPPLGDRLPAKERPAPEPGPGRRPCCRSSPRCPRTRAAGACAEPGPRPPRTWTCSCRERVQRLQGQPQEFYPKWRNPSCLSVMKRQRVRRTLGQTPGTRVPPPGARPCAGLSQDWTVAIISELLSRGAGARRPGPLTREAEMRPPIAPHPGPGPP